MKESAAHISPRDKRLAELWRAGQTTSQIAAELGATPGAVTQVLRRLRLAGHDLPARRARPWTPEDDSQLLRIAASDGRAAAAAALERTRAAIDRRLVQLAADGQPLPASAFSAGPRSWTPADDEALITGYAAGHTLQQLAERLGRTVHVVHTRLAQLRTGGADLPARRPRWTAAEQQLLAERYRQGATYAQLGRELGGRSKGTISRQLAALRASGVDLQREPKQPTLRLARS